MKANDRPPRVVFMGTPAIAVPFLTALAKRQPRPWRLVGAVTQPDRPRGRRRAPQPSPVKQAALELGLPLLQPESFRRNPEAVNALARWRPDAAVVVAFGQILPGPVLAVPRLGCLNVHFSLLPAYRGASPVATAILNGEPESGVSLMLIDAGLDTGPVLAQLPMEIAPRDTTRSLEHRMALQGAEFLDLTLPRWLAGEVRPRPQAELPGTPSECRMWRKEHGRLDWQIPALQLERQVRACTDWPGAFSLWREQNVRILEAECDPDLDLGEASGSIRLTPQGLAVQTGRGVLLIRRLQLAGRKPAAADAFLNGAGREMPGTRFDEGSVP